MNNACSLYWLKGRWIWLPDSLLATKWIQLPALRCKFLPDVWHWAKKVYRCTMHKAFFTTYSQTALLHLRTSDGPDRIFCLPPYAAAWSNDMSLAVIQSHVSCTRLGPLKDALPTELQHCGTMHIVLIGSKVGGSDCLIHFWQPSGSSSQLYLEARRLYELVSDGAYADHDLLHFGRQELTYFSLGITTVIYRCVNISKTLIYSWEAKENHVVLAGMTLELALYWSASFIAS